MATFVLRLKASRPTFATDMTDDERAIMGRHAEHWQPWIAAGRVAVFGPVVDDETSWGLAVVQTDDEAELRAFVAADPAVATGTTEPVIGSLVAGFVRPG
jgi:uncharacterized protein YciI